MTNTVDPKSVKALKAGSYVNVSFVNNEEMQKLNLQYRQKDYPTDVLSFNYDEEEADGKFHLGDIVVNVDRVKKQAGDYGNDFEHEVAELVAHGMLHLQGVHHDGDDH